MAIYLCIIIKPSWESRYAKETNSDGLQIIPIFFIIIKSLIWITWNFQLLWSALNKETVDENFAPIYNLKCWWCGVHCYKKKIFDSDSYLGTYRPMLFAFVCKYCLMSTCLQIAFLLHTPTNITQEEIMVVDWPLRIMISQGSVSMQEDINHTLKKW